PEYVLSSPSRGLHPAALRVAVGEYAAPRFEGYLAPESALVRIPGLPPESGETGNTRSRANNDLRGFWLLSLSSVLVPAGWIAGRLRLAGDRSPRRQGE